MQQQGCLLRAGLDEGPGYHSTLRGTASQPQGSRCLAHHIAGSCYNMAPKQLVAGHLSRHYCLRAKYAPDNRRPSLSLGFKAINSLQKLYLMEKGSLDIWSMMSLVDSRA